MNIFQSVDCIYLFDKLIRDEATGNPETFARRLYIGRTKLFSLIEEFNSRGCQITYSRSRETYFYKSPVEVNITLSIKPLDTKEVQNISGGTDFSIPVRFFELSICNFVSVISE